MRQSGLADLLPSLRETVYVGVSAGSMVTPLPSARRTVIRLAAAVMRSHRKTSCSLHPRRHQHDLRHG